MATFWRLMAEMSETCGGENKRGAEYISAESIRKLLREYERGIFKKERVGGGYLHILRERKKKMEQMEQTQRLMYI